MSRRTTILLVVVALSVLSTAGLIGQAGSTFQFVVFATNKAGDPVTDLKPEDVLMSEKAGKATVTKVEPFAVPVKITIAVDNGSDVDSKGNSVPTSALAISNYRNGLKGFVEAFPADTEVTLITTSPQPRMVVKESRDRAVILRGINGFSPEMERPRFTDALVEYARRLEAEIKDPKFKLYVPILLMVSTAANETVSYQVAEVERAMKFLVARKAMMYVTVNSTRSGDGAATADLNGNRQAVLAIPITKAVNGRYEAIAIFNRLDTLLPEMGKELAAYAKRLSSQYVVTVQRAGSGPIEELGIELAREGLQGSFSPDGYLPR